MKRALVVLGFAALAGGAMAVPTAAILDDVATWTFLTDAQRETLTGAKVALQKGEWRKALQLNEELLSGVPDTIYSADPKLPVLVIKPSGSNQTAAQRVVAGWLWKLEVSQLALLALDFEGAVKRATLVRDAGVEHRASAYRVMAMARARQGRYVDAQKLIIEADRLDRKGREEWQIWDQARLLTTEAKMWLDQIGVGTSTPIGGGQLPGVGQSVPAAPDAQRIEACLVLGDWASRSGEDVLAASYYDRALKIATKRNLSGLLAVTLWKRVQPPKE